MTTSGQRLLVVAVLVAVLGLLVGDTARVAVRGILYLLAAGAGYWTLRDITARLTRAHGAFWILTASCGTYAASNLTRAALPDQPIGEALQAVASLLLLVAGVVFIRRIRPGHGPRIVLDGLIVGLVAALALREVAVATGSPALGESGASVLVVVGLVGTSMWLRVVAADPSGAVQAFAIAAGLAMPGTFLTTTLGFGPVRPLWVDIWTLASTVVLVHALSHPALGGVRQAPVPAFRHVTASSVGLMVLALAVAPCLMWSRFARGESTDLIIGLGLSVITVAWVLRFSLMLIDRDADRARLDRELATDPLTRIASRRCLTDHLDAVLARPRGEGEELGLLMADVDDFKQVNDEHGHRTGDLALIAVATLLREVVGDRWLVARLSGDEFAVALHTPDPLAVQREVSTALECVRVGRHPLVEVRLSVGMALAREEERSSQQLLERADRAMYARKRHQRDRVS